MRLVALQAMKHRHRRFDGRFKREILTVEPDDDAGGSRAALRACDALTTAPSIVEQGFFRAPIGG